MACGLRTPDLPTADDHAGTLVRAGVTLGFRVRRADHPAPGRVLVLLHGLASNLTRWTEFVATTRLARAWTLVRVDLRGHGTSPTDGPIDLERWCDDLAAVLDHLEAPQAVLLGHSLGAQVALQFAARHPQRTRALGLIDPVFRAALLPRRRWYAWSAPAFAVLARVCRGVAALGWRRALAPLDLQALDAKARVALRDPASEAAFIRHYSSLRADLRHVTLAAYLQDAVEMFRPVPPLAALSMPVLLLLSRGGTFADPQRMAMLARAIAALDLQWVDCHHWPLTERPEAVRAAVEAWVEALPASARTDSSDRRRP